MRLPKGLTGSGMFTPLWLLAARTLKAQSKKRGGVDISII